MIPIKTIILNGKLIDSQLNFNSDYIETKFRNRSAKRYAWIDLIKSYEGASEGKLFFGTENSKKIKLTRIRGGFTFLLPKVILVFHKETGFEEVKIRLSLTPSLIAILLLIITLSVSYKLISNNEINMSILKMPIILITFVLLTFLELHFLEKTIHKTLSS